MKIRTGIDLGGTKIEIIALNSNDNVIYQKRIATPQNNYPATMTAIVDLITELEINIEQKTSIGIGTPGAISPHSGQLKNSNSTCLNGQYLQQDLEDRLDRTIRLSNDANCFTLSESYDGAAANADTVFGVIIGTGTGAGIVINQKIIHGANQIAGEWGHNPLPWPDNSELIKTQCYCGKSDCIETYLSGPGMEADYLRVTKHKIGSKEIVKLANQGNTACEECLQRYENRLARSLAHVINILDPEIIVLGGGMSNIARLYKHVPELWKQYIFSDQVVTKLVSAKYGDASGVRGAARLSG